MRGVTPRGYPRRQVAAEIENSDRAGNVVEFSGKLIECANAISRTTEREEKKQFEISGLQSGGKGGTRTLDPGIMVSVWAEPILDPV